MSDSNSSSGHIGFTNMLAILFIGLKLAHFIDWSWWWVLSPLWIPFAIVLGAILVFGALVAVMKIGKQMGRIAR